jgi:hypothetical protein
MVVQLLLLANPAGWTMALWLGFGFWGTSGILAYAALSQSFPAHLTGRVSTAVNLLVFVAAFAGQWAIGVIVGWWPQAGQGQFAAAGLRAGFACLLACQVIAFGWFLFAGWQIRRNKGAKAAG